jgi:DNA-binding XRE family transcriptional regulator
VTLDSDRLRQARDRAGLSQRRLASAAGVGRATIGKLESQDRPRCHFRTSARVASALVPVARGRPHPLGSKIFYRVEDTGTGFPAIGLPRPASRASPLYPSHFGRVASSAVSHC